MSSKAHTSGPWQVKRIPDGFVLKQTGGHGKYLFNLEECPGIPEAEANARMIAAAPDMLAALQAMDEFAWSAVECDCKESFAGLAECIAKVRSAIAKAEGRS